MSNVRAIAAELVVSAQNQRVRFPKTWDEARTLQACGAVLLSFRDGATFDSVAALNSLIETYGQEAALAGTATAAATTTTIDAAESKDEKSSSSASLSKKRKVDAAKDEFVGAEASSSSSSPSKESKASKIKKTDTFANERNRDVGQAIKEMGDVYYKNKDVRKGGVFSKAAKAIREWDEAIETAKDAMKLKGVGKGIAGYIAEFRETGMIVKLEELRSGEA